MKKLAVLSLALLMAACSNYKVGKKKPVFKSGEIVNNQFIFSGDQAVVAKYLKEQGVKYQFVTLDKQDEFYQVKYSGANLDVGQIMVDLDGKVKSIEPNRIFATQSSMNKYEWPSDKFFFKQWGLNNIGQTAPFGISGKRGADMGILDAWKKTKGKGSVIAVIDTGCDYTHPDLKGSILVNQKEAPANGGITGVDDDKNGYTDDVYGYDFVSRGRTTPYYGVPGDPDPMDESDHGTHCSGAIAATADNGIGVAGVAPEAKLICVRVGDESGLATVDIFRGIRYAISRHVDIMTNSYGGDSERESPLISSIIEKAEQAGILFVVAAGNNGTDNDVKRTYPADMKLDGLENGKFKNVLVVGASDNEDNPASWSNYGANSVDVFAPGVNIVSTIPNKTHNPTGVYAVMSGTSMATPYVAGVAALLISYNPALRGHPDEIVRLIDSTAAQKASMVGKAVSNGRIDAVRALEQSYNKANLSNVNWLYKADNYKMKGFNKELVDIRKEFHVEGAKEMKIHFNFVQLEPTYDSVYIYDKNFRLITEVDTLLTNDLWSGVVPGDTVYVRFVNSLVKEVKINPLGGGAPMSESSCESSGATSMTPAGNDKYICSGDSEDSSMGGDGSTEYTTFNSEGFSVDQIAYVPADKPAPAEQAAATPEKQIGEGK